MNSSTRTLLSHQNNNSHHHQQQPPLFQQYHHQQYDPNNDNNIVKIMNSLMKAGIESVTDKSVPLSQTMVYSLNTNNREHHSIESLPPSSSSSSSSAAASASSSLISNDVNSLFLEQLNSNINTNNNDRYSRDSLMPLFRFHRNASSPFSSGERSDNLLTNITNNIKQNVSSLNDSIEASSSSLLDLSSEESDNSLVNSLSSATVTTTNLPILENALSIFQNSSDSSSTAVSTNLTTNSSTIVIDSTLLTPTINDYDDDIWINQNIPILVGIATGLFVLILVLVILLCHFCDVFRRCRHDSDDASYCGRDHSSRSSLTSSEHHPHHHLHNHHHSSKHHASTLYINNPNSLDLSCHDPVNCASVCCCNTTTTPGVISSSAAITRSLSVPGQQQTIYGTQLSKNIINYYESQQQQQHQSQQAAVTKLVEALPKNICSHSGIPINSDVNASTAVVASNVINNDTSSLNSSSTGELLTKRSKNGLLLNDFIYDDRSLFASWSSNDRFSSASLISSANNSDSSTLQRLNFTKNRRNRMRNDSAAAIALIKSGVFIHNREKLNQEFTGRDVKQSICDESLFHNTWDTIPEVAFGGSSPVQSLNATTTAGSNGNNSSTIIAQSQSNNNNHNNNTIIPKPVASQPTIVTAISASTSSSLQQQPVASSQQYTDLSLSDSNEAIVVYNERTAL